jgi:hypothetical protein
MRWADPEQRLSRRNQRKVNRAKRSTTDFEETVGQRASPLLLLRQNGTCTASEHLRLGGPHPTTSNAPYIPQASFWLLDK